MKKKYIRGFTLLEVMIFTIILSIVLVTAASFVTRLVISVRSNEYRANAGFLADDVKEWLSGERESNDWITFHGKASTAGIRYCLNQQLELSHTIANLGTSLFPSPAAGCSGYTNIQSGLSPIYKRELTLTKDTGSTQVTALISVSWLEIGRTENTQVQSVYIAPF